MGVMRADRREKYEQTLHIRESDGSYAQRQMLDTKDSRYDRNSDPLLKIYKLESVTNSGYGKHLISKRLREIKFKQANRLNQSQP